MGARTHRIRVGTASWTDKTLLASGWYPDGVDTPEKRLAYYANRFPMVEVDSTYYSPPRREHRDPVGPAHARRLSVQHQGLQPAHRTPTKISAIYKDLRPETEKKNLYPDDLPTGGVRAGVGAIPFRARPLVGAGKLGVVLFQFPPWFTIRYSNKQYLLEVARRCSPLRVAIELRHKSWFEGDNQAETLDFLREHELPFVCVDMPQGHNSSIPPVLAATADLAMVRFHGHSDKWTSKDIYEKFGYRYSKAELTEWAPKLEQLSTEAAETHVLMNNCYSDYAQTNAADLIDLLGGD
jgi:uncharacterized protein YecE (DUF72 family)